MTSFNLTISSLSTAWKLLPLALWDYFAPACTPLPCIPIWYTETWVQSLGWEDPLEEGNSFQYSCLEKPMDRGAGGLHIHSIAKSQTQLKELSMHTCPLPSCECMWTVNLGQSPLSIVECHVFGHFILFKVKSPSFINRLNRRSSEQCPKYPSV